MATDPVLASTVAFLRNHPPFDQMEEGLLGELAADLSMAYFPAGAVVLSPDAGPPPYLYIVQRGLVQLQPAEGYHVSAGSVVTLAPGECFSVYALMEKRAVASPYTAASDTFCYRLPVASFNRLLDRSPRFREFSTDYLRSLLRDSRRLIRMHGASAAAEQQAMNQPLRHLATRAPVLMALGTKLTVISPKGERSIALEDFFTGYYETVLEKNELIAEVHIPAQGSKRAAYMKVTTGSADDWPALGVAVVQIGRAHV